MNTRDKEKLLRDLKESEDRYRSVTETSIDAIITANDGDSILTWNKGAELIFGYGPEIVGRSVTTIIPERYRKAHHDGVKRFLKTGEKHLLGKKLELMALRKDGTEFPIELSLSSWQSASGAYFGAIIRDITERRQIERIREDVQQMTRHDLKSPLIGITGLAKRLQKGSNLTDRQKKAAALIQELGERTLHWIDRSRDLFQMEQGIYELTAHPVNIIDLLNRIGEQLEPLTLKKGISIRVEVSGQPAEKGHEIMSGDEALLEMMFGNLLKNAIEASPENAPIKISIQADEKGGQKIHIVDIHNRWAIPKEVRDTFFDAYTTSGKKDGTGLGTYNSMLIARTHRGDIRFTTSDAEGTHIIVSLPHGMIG
jgi:PAS domain S-box-containing protein